VSAAAVPNIERLERALDDAGVDVLILRSGENFTYLTQLVYPGTLARHLDLAGSRRAAVLIWPRRGTPEIVLNDFAAGLTRLRSKLPLTLYEGYRDDPYDALGRRLVELGFNGATIGYESGYVGDGDAKTLRQHLPKARWTDVTALMERVRWVKTPSEIALLKRAADLLDEAYLRVFPTIRPGDSERQVHARITKECLELGFESLHGILNTSRNPVIYNGEGDTRFERGDVVRTDYVCYLQGYPGHQSRNAVLGPPSAEVRDTYRKVREVYGLLIEQIRSGVVVGALYDHVCAEFARRGLTYGSLLIGHSVGAWFHQQEPIMRRGSTIELETGMVLALEPYFESYHIQDLVVVEAGGCRLLSDRFDTRELFVIDS
jgi:Xaa-Pro aminopeptidase